MAVSFKTFVIISLSGALGSALTMAQANEVDPQAITTITVTAQKREQDLQDVALSISAYSGSNLEDAEVATMTELSRLVPNLQVFSWGGRRDTNVFIRGIGPGLFTEPTVGFYVDGVNYLSNGMFDLELLDIEQVEILRGPQGTLYGGNSLAGVINITTAAPADVPEVRLSLQGHHRGMAQLKGAASAPLGHDAWHGKFSFSTVHADGFMRSVYDDQRLDQQQDHTARVQILGTPSQDFQVRWILDGEHFDGGSYSYAPLAELQDNRFVSSTVVDGRDRRDSLGSSLQLDQQFGSFKLVSVTSWRSWESSNLVDQFLPEYGFYDSRTDEEQTQWTQELRMLSNREGRLQWLAGLYAYRKSGETDSLSRADYTSEVMGGPYVDVFQYDRKDSGYAAFGQLDYRLAERWTLTAGLRYDREEREIDAWVDRQTMGTSYAVVDDLSFDKWLPKVSLAYAQTPNVMWYGTAAQGYRAGGFDTLYMDAERPAFDPEQSNNYELGLKTRFWSDRATLNAALFYIEITDQQVQRIIPSVSAFNIITDNAGESRSQGMEVEWTLQAHRSWTLDGSLGYTDAEFVDYKFDEITQYRGNQMPFAPKINGHFGVQYHRHLVGQVNLFSRLDLAYMGDHYFDAANSLKQSAYTLLNAKIGLEAPSWDFNLWVKNLTNEFYSTVITQQGLTPLAQLGDPRLVGLTLNWNF